MQPAVTALGVAALRALYDSMPLPLGFVRDPFAASLLPQPLRSLVRSVRSRPRLARAFHAALRTVSRDLSTSSPLRTLAIDTALAQAVEQGARQLVLLGAGLDARAWRCPELARVSVFELDREGSLTYKRKRLPSRSLALEHTFVPTDFARDDLASLLPGAGLDPALPTVWIWEGVIIYLPLAAIQSTLHAVSRLSAPSSTLIATYTRPGLGRAHGPTLHLRAAARIIGEPLRGEVSTDSLHALLAAGGFTLAADHSVSHWACEYLPPPTRTSPDWERLVVARKQSPPAREA